MGKKVILRLLRVVLLSSLMPHGRAAAQLAYGLRGGVGFPTLRSTFVDRTNRTANIVGFHAGASIAYFFTTAPGLYIESGVQLALLGGASLNVNWYNPLRPTNSAATRLLHTPGRAERLRKRGIPAERGPMGTARAHRARRKTQQQFQNWRRPQAVRRGTIFPYRRGVRAPSTILRDLRRLRSHRHLHRERRGAHRQFWAITSIHVWATVRVPNRKIFQRASEKCQRPPVVTTQHFTP